MTIIIFYRQTCASHDKCWVIVVLLLSIDSTDNNRNGGMTYSIAYSGDNVWNSRVPVCGRPFGQLYSRRLYTKEKRHYIQATTTLRTRLTERDNLARIELGAFRAAPKPLEARHFSVGSSRSYPSKPNLSPRPNWRFHGATSCVQLHDQRMRGCRSNSRTKEERLQ